MKIFSFARARLQFVRPLLALALLAFALAVPAHAFVYVYEQPATPSSEQTSAAPTKEAKPAAPEQKAAAENADEEENANLKYAAPVQWLARHTGWSAHFVYMLALSVNFAIIAVVVFWVARKYVPGMMRNRSAVIQQALEEARAASRDANRRLADVEHRLHQLDVEIGQMQASAEKESSAEELRIEKAAAEDIRKVVAAAEQEIAAAAKQARRELSNHTAGLAIALARKEIDIQPNTDQVLVRTFASKLASPGSSRESDGGKDGK